MWCPKTTWSSRWLVGAWRYSFTSILTSPDSSSKSDETISNPNIDEDDGNIFSKLFGFMGLGDNGASPCDNPVTTPISSADESIDKLEMFERIMTGMGWIFGSGGGGGLDDPTAARHCFCPMF